jgi:hypothetical protein
MQTNSVAADPRLLRLAQELDRERRERIRAQRQTRALKLALSRVLAAQRKAKPAESASTA